MSGIDRIGGGGGPQGPEGPEGPRGADGVQKGSGNFKARLDPTQGAQAAAGPQGELTFPALRDRILAGVDAGLGREEILKDVVDDEATRVYGDNATSSMTESVSQAFSGTEQLRHLFDRLYQAATRERS